MQPSSGSPARVAHDGVRVRASAGASSFRRLRTLERLREEARARVAALRRELDAAPGACGARGQARRERATRLFNAQFTEIALHAHQECGRFRAAPQHLASRKIALVESGATELLRRARLVGPQSARWAEAMLKQRGIAGVRVLVGLLSLLRTHASTAVEQACELAAGHGAFRLRELHALLRQPVAQPQLEFMSEHPVIRSLKAYGAVVHRSPAALTGRAMHPEEQRLLINSLAVHEDFHNAGT